MCLANSRKWQGRCIAGLEWNGKRFGSWVRPIAASGKGELKKERLLNGGKDPDLLDIIEIEFSRHCPAGCHTEDHLVNRHREWRLKGVMDSARLIAATQVVADVLWINGHSTRHGRNDEIPANLSANLKSSLSLVRPKKLRMVLQMEGAPSERQRRRIRGHFSLGNSDYALSVTDSIVEESFRKAQAGASRTITNPFLCISVSEVFEKRQACYKLIAGVIE